MSNLKTLENLLEEFNNKRFTVINPFANNEEQVIQIQDLKNILIFFGNCSPFLQDDNVTDLSNAFFASLFSWSRAPFDAMPLKERKNFTSLWEMISLQGSKKEWNAVMHLKEKNIQHTHIYDIDKVIEIEKEGMLNYFFNNNWTEPKYTNFPINNRYPFLSEQAITTLTDFAIIEELPEFNSLINPVISFENIVFEKRTLFNTIFHKPRFKKKFQDNFSFSLRTLNNFENPYALSPELKVLAYQQVFAKTDQRYTKELCFNFRNKATKHTVFHVSDVFQITAEEAEYIDKMCNFYLESVYPTVFNFIVDFIDTPKASYLKECYKELLEFFNRDFRFEFSPSQAIMARINYDLRKEQKHEKR